MVTALIMAGGKGTRMKFNGEKPLIKINGKPMISHVINALERTNNIKNIVVATSKHTQHTRKLMEKLGIKTIETPGNGYIEDLRFILAEPGKSGLNKILLTITADLPLIKSSTIDYVISRYKKSNKPAMCVAVPVEVFQRYGLKPSMIFDGMVPSGLNILRRINKKQDEEVLIIKKIELALNINNCKDIKFLEKLLGDKND